MNHDTHNTEQGSSDAMELFLSRAVDGEATREQWARFEESAARSPDLWRRLACAQRDHAQLSREVAAVVACAESIELPETDDEDVEGGLVGARGRSRFASVRSWGGWAAAAALLLAMVSQSSRLGGSGITGTSGATPGGTLTAGPSFGSANDALDAYLTKGRESGRVLGEVPDKVIVDTRSMEDGAGVEVIYVRQIVERARLKDVYRLSHDEAGRPTPVPAREVMRYIEAASRRGGAL